VGGVAHGFCVKQRGTMRSYQMDQFSDWLSLVFCRDIWLLVCAAARRSSCEVPTKRPCSSLLRRGPSRGDRCGGPQHFSRSEVCSGLDLGLKPGARDGVDKHRWLGGDGFGSRFVRTPGSATRSHSPILRSDWVEFVLAVVFLLMVFGGAVLALMGLPTGVFPR
jgi:hypothetical protein